MKSLEEFLQESNKTKKRSQPEEGCKEYKACVREKSKDPDIDDPELACAGVGGKGKRPYRLRKSIAMGRTFEEFLEERGEAELLAEWKKRPGDK